MGNNRSSALFLMELILSILIFAAAASVCIRIFAQAHTLTQNAQALNHAVNECVSAAETVSVSEGLDDAKGKICSLYSLDEPRGDTITVFFDDDFKQCSKEDSTYFMVCSLSMDDSMLEADIHVNGKDSEEIFSLPAAHHIRGGN